MNIAKLYNRETIIILKDKIIVKTARLILTQVCAVLIFSLSL